MILPLDYGAYYYQTRTVTNKLVNVAFAENTRLIYKFTDYTLHKCRSRFEHDHYSAPYVDRSKRYGFSFTPTTSLPSDPTKPEEIVTKIIRGICRYPTVLSANENLFSKSGKQYIDASTKLPSDLTVASISHTTHITTTTGVELQECLRIYDPFEPPPTTYSLGSTLYYPQLHGDAVTELTVQEISNYEFTETSSTMCGPWVPYTVLF